jgi:uncharacterized protein
MTNLDQSPQHSPLTQSLTRDGKTVQVHIYDDGKNGWLLEVVDEYGNSTVWDASFMSDQAALDEACRTIDEEGIETLIGLPPSNMREVTALDHTLSNEEFDELDDFLADDAIAGTSMDVSTLDGFLTAIAIGPQMVLPSEWLPWVWDMEEGEAEPAFEDNEQVNRIMSLMMRHHNAVMQTFNTHPASFEPLFWRSAHWGAAEWCEGFILGSLFNENSWSSLTISQPAWFAPFLRLGSDEGIALTDRTHDAEKWINEIVPSLVKIHAFWKENPGSPASGQFKSGLYRGEPKELVTLVRNGPKIGRNDPCPCGSGKKFKKCCEMHGTTPSLH